MDLSWSLVCAFLYMQPTSSPEAVLDRIRSRVAVAPVAGDRESIAGKYTSTPKELAAGSLSGEELHLFPDGTYIYAEWSDVEPLTVLDKGTWRLSGLTLGLTSDSDVKWKPMWGCCSPLERQYLTLRRAGRKRDVVLMGMGYSLAGFEENSKDDPNLVLLVNGLLRTEVYKRERATKVKSRLMKVIANRFSGQRSLR